MMVSLLYLPRIYPLNPQKVFEDLATEIFCEELELSHGVLKRRNQRAIESDPVRKENKKYAYQAKFYDSKTEIKDRKNELIKCIKGASIEAVTDLMLFINKEIENRRNEKEVSYIREIESNANACGIKLHWWTRSVIESSLERPKFSRIKSKYFGSGNIGEKIVKFYNKAVEVIEKCPEKESVYGNISLKNGYLEPYIIFDGNNCQVRDYIEKWINSNEKILLIHGEPGHGKTSLCWKAMYDAYKAGWLTDKVYNVFWFSLNPTYIDMDKNTFNPNNFLSWGDAARGEPEYFLGRDVCRKALVFFDAYDELVECTTDYSNGGSIKTDLASIIDKLIDFQKETESHIVITTRTMAIRKFLYAKENQEKYSRMRNSSFERVLVYQLQPVSKSAQIDWIKHYSSFQNERGRSFDWKQYLNRYKKSFNQGDYNKIIGVPAIFRMIVSVQYLPKQNVSIVQLYNELFEETWKRHKRPDQLSDEKAVCKSLQVHALKLYINDSETAIYDSNEEFSWLFAFYTTPEGEKRVGFLHRSFYHYFLAREIASWYTDYAESNNKQIFQENLMSLACRRIDSTTLDYMRQMNNVDNQKKQHSVGISLMILKETDGYLQHNNAIDLTDIYHDQFIEIINKTTPLTRMNNTFWNIISIGSIYNRAVKADEINIDSLRKYDFDYCDLHGANLSGADFRGANLRYANLSQANLSGAIFIGANLSHANLSQANLSRAIFKGADLSGADFSGNNTILSRASFIHATLTRANLESAIIDNADFHSADIIAANIQNANLYRADFRSANLSGAKLCNADLKGARLNRANLSKADLSGSYLQNADLSGADLSSADFSSAILDNAYFYFADLSDAKLNNASLYYADLGNAYLDRTELKGAILSGTRFNGATADYHTAERLKGRKIDISNIIIIKND